MNHSQTHDLAHNLGSRRISGVFGVDTGVEAIDFVRRLWQRETPTADRVMAVWREGKGPEAAAGEADVLTADAEMRASRGVDAKIEAYAREFPGILHNAEACRSILMQEFARLSTADRAKASARVGASLPTLAGEALGVAALCDAMASDEAGADDAKEGATLGKYRLLKRLGSGAFGAVWHAVDTELKRPVALKLLHRHGLLSGVGGLAGLGVSEAAGVRRVMAEAQAAAGLDHPNVVKIHAAGRLPDGRAYIDAQLVADPSPSDAATPIVGGSLEHRITNEKSRDPRWAARIMEQVARGVAAAHARGVIHRDIKPANIIVTPSGRPMLADFGLSALTVLPAGTAGVGTVPARSGAVPISMPGKVTGTPAFMAPEQARGERATPASDIYALGATLRYLLTGELPVKPSGRHSTEGRTDVLEQLRRGELGTLEGSASGARLPRALVRIADRATATGIDGRYASAAALADDLAAWLDGRPTLAGRESVPARVGLWVRRHAVAAAVAAVVLGAFAFLLQQHVTRLGAERDRAVAAEKDADEKRVQAQRETAIARAVSDFMESTIVAAQADAGGKRVTLYDAITKASDAVTKGTAGIGTEPLVEAGVRNSIGRVLTTLGEFPKAEEHLRRALDLRSRDLGPTHADTIETRFHLAEMLSFSERIPAASDLAEPVLAQCREHLGESHRTTISARELLAEIRIAQMRFDDARTLLLQVLDDRRKADPVEELKIAMTHSQLGALAKMETNREAAIEHFNKAIEIRRRIVGEDAVETMSTTNDLGSVYAELGDVEKAEPLQRAAYAWFVREMGPGHVSTINAGHNVAWMLLTKKKNFAEALEIASPLGTHAAASLGKGNLAAVRVRLVEGRALAGLKRDTEAEAVLTEVAALAAALGAAGRAQDSVASRTLAAVLERLGRSEEAATWKARAEARAADAKAGR
jgi:eukaryotic-like serine/threonine-protein kinase